MKEEIEYRLIKSYPSLPKDWEIGMIVGLGDRGPFCSFSPCNGKYRDYYVPFCEVVNNPEFWEKVVKKDYEILSVKDKLNYIYTLKDNGLYSLFDFQGIFTLKECLYNFKNKIHSIKRLSDGEVFTVGNKYSNLSGTFTIQKFTLENNKIMVHAIEFGGCLLNNISKVKQPLFTTEDGVDIYETQEIWVIDENFEYYLFRTPEPVSIKPLDKRHYFSSKEKAEEYILLNKPCLSLNDVASIYPGINREHNTPSHQAERLKQLVKDKLCIQK